MERNRILRINSNNYWLFYSHENPGMLLPDGSQHAAQQLSQIFMTSANYHFIQLLNGAELILKSRNILFFFFTLACDPVQINDELGVWNLSCLKVNHRAQARC